MDNGQGGKAYFVTDDDLTSMRQFVTDVAEASGQPAKARAVPYWFGALLARVMGVAFALFRPGKQPPLTLETVRLIGKRLELSNALAKRELGYAPQVSREVGVARMRAKASNKIVRRGSTRASVAAQTLVILALVATALTTTIRFCCTAHRSNGAMAALRRQDRQGQWRRPPLHRGRYASWPHRTTARRKLTRGQVHQVPSATEGQAVSRPLRGMGPQARR